MVTDPLRGVDCSWRWSAKRKKRKKLPTPCGEWIAADDIIDVAHGGTVTDPLRGVDCSKKELFPMEISEGVTDPLRGVGCSEKIWGYVVGEI